MQQLFSAGSAYVQPNGQIGKSRAIYAAAVIDVPRHRDATGTAFVDVQLLVARKRLP